MLLYKSAKKYQRGTRGFTVWSFFSNGMSVILILMCGIAVSSSPAACGFLCLWLTVFDKRRSFTVQWNPALRTPALYGQFRLSRQKAHIFSLKLTRFIRTPVNTDNGHFSVSRVTNSHILSTPLYGHWLSAHCLFSLSQLCDNCRHCTLFK